MKQLLIQSREVAYNLLIALQALFLATVTWDFFLTVLVPNSHRALVFSGLGSAATVYFVIVPWAICILWALISFIAFLCNTDHNPVRGMTHYKYATLGLIYLCFTVLAILNPAVMWPIVLNYIITVTWAGIILYYRVVIGNLYKDTDDTAK
jgi:hypothetical protein